MSRRPSIRRSRLAILPLAIALASTSQATEFVFEGELQEYGQPANGVYDLQLTPYADAKSALPLGAASEFPAVEVIDGRFRVSLDVPGQIDAPALAVAVRGSGEKSGYSPLPGRQQAKAGPIGVCWSTTGDEGAIAGTHFLGTTDNRPLELRVNNQPFLRALAESAGGTPNILMGHSANQILDGDGIVIAGGGRAGKPNTASKNNATISGGAGNQVSAAGATLAGGVDNTASGQNSVVSGGASNIAAGDLSHIGGGQANRTPGNGGVVVGGGDNVASGLLSTVLGGFSNTASGLASGVIGGTLNCAGGSASLAAGFNAKVRPSSNNGTDPGTACAGVPTVGDGGDIGTFVWADATGPEFVSTGENQFLIRATGGVGINTNAPRAPLTVIGENKWSPNIGNGWGDFTVGSDVGGLAIGTRMDNSVAAGNVRVWTKGGTENLSFTSASRFPTPTLDLQGSSGRVGVGRIAAANMFEVEGNASKSMAGDWLSNSDARIKTEVTNVESPLERLLRLRPVTFRYTDEYLAEHPAIPDVVYFNVIAQEFAEVFPEAVKPSGEYLPGQPQTDDNAILQVDFHPANVVTIAAVQELAVRLERAEAENAAMLARLAKLEELLNTQER